MSSIIGDRQARNMATSESSRSPSGPAESTCQERQAELDYLLLVLVDRLRARIARVAAEVGLTPQQAILLRHLGQPKTMGNIAHVLGCDRSNVTGLVDRMTARGLLERVADAQDRRIKYLVLTDAGQALRASLQDRLFTESPEINSLPLSERRQLLLLLRKLTPDVGDEERLP
jgi:DNA-binding MarR family transcriptional regulator